MISDLMDEEIEEYDYETAKEVGRVSYEALQHGKGLIKEGAKLLDIAKGIEGFITDKGFGLAFPANISINENAAHYTPSATDTTEVPAGAVVKVDVGARREEYLGDCALTVDLSGKYQKMVEASEKALEAAVGMVRAGRKVNEIGREIEGIAKKHGVEPIRNLGGHGVERHDLHAGVFIPNYDNGDTTELEEGSVIAIEPFMTDGEGFVIEGTGIEIFQKTGEARLRSQDARAVADVINGKYSTYPFAARWLDAEFQDYGEFRIRKALTELSYAGALETFPVLVERKKGIVAQAEAEMIVEKDSCTVITR